MYPDDSEGKKAVAQITHDVIQVHSTYIGCSVRDLSMPVHSELSYPVNDPISIFLMDPSNFRYDSIWPDAV